MIILSQLFLGLQFQIEKIFSWQSNSFGLSGNFQLPPNNSYKNYLLVCDKHRRRESTVKPLWLVARVSKWDSWVSNLGS
jgi:hypothetical protein